MFIVADYASLTSKQYEKFPIKTAQNRGANINMSEISMQGLNKRNENC